MNKQILESLKEHYPSGTRVKLLEMDDPQAPPVGTLGTVMAIDDIGSLIVRWDTGSQLHVLFGVDRVQKV